MPFIPRSHFIATNPGRVLQLHPLLRAISSGERSIEIFERLVKVWGNPWSADAHYLRQLSLEIDASSGGVLECGSGLTSVVAYAVCRPSGRELLCLEHDPDWFVLNRVDACLAGYPRTPIVRAPMKVYDTFHWFTLPTDDLLPRTIGVVACDGPPGSTKGGRYGVVPVLGNRLAGSLILVDDADRKGETAAIERWILEVPGTTVEWTPASDGSKAFAAVRLGDGAAPS